MHPHPAQNETATTIEIEIEVRGRWDALALSELLIPFHGDEVTKNAATYEATKIRNAFCDDQTDNA